jgi:hypothetical protein
MWIKNSLALLMTLAVTSGALAGPQRHHNRAGSDAVAAHKLQRAPESAFGSYRLPTETCAQSGPITLPATNPICNRKGWFTDPGR